MNNTDRKRLQRIHHALNSLGPPIRGLDSASIQAYVKYSKKAEKLISAASEALEAMAWEHIDNFESTFGELNAEPFISALESAAEEAQP